MHLPTSSPIGLHSSTSASTFTPISTAALHSLIHIYMYSWVTLTFTHLKVTLYFYQLHNTCLQSSTVTTQHFMCILILHLLALVRTAWWSRRVSGTWEYWTGVDLMMALHEILVVSVVCSVCMHAQCATHVASGFTREKGGKGISEKWEWNTHWRNVPILQL